MPRDVLLDPPVSTWDTAPDVAAATSGGPADVGLVVPLVVGGDGAATAALGAVGLDPAEVLATYEPERTVGAVTAVPLPGGGHPVRRVHLVGVGAGSAADWRRAGAEAGRATRRRPAVVHALGGAADAVALAAWTEGAVLGGWGAPAWTADGAVARTGPAEATTVVTDVRDAVEVVRRSVVVARAQLLARSLAMTPSNVKDPAWMADRARLLGDRHGLDVTVWDETALADEGFGGLLAVGGGSASPPRLVRVDHAPAGAVPTTPRVVLVGKGITFDTGGLQVKPVAGMVGMKTDMAGSATVLAVVAACAELEVPVRVTGLLALAENAVGGGSYRPGDVVTHYGGRTVEITNTDAEGRIVLADALAYADAELDPDVLIDVATLTGAARVALGREAAPVFGTDDDLAAELVAAGESSGETLWRMPLPDTYRAVLDSDVADLRHFAPGVGGGAVLAALFLREFVGPRRWAHLDVAGTGRSDVDAGTAAKGATGFGVRLLLRWLEETR
ncbi:leucyl aminopeptidase family protein [Phycicoccus flavus]|uniref:leucyl aminopeptidase family protein n=1 Tax=Phycicoccus flavus TaxID=2502783 RepID=UPI000FEC01C9|nr:leucyl aminopeptidase family protein [Phycicoccus flavus]NHA68744.1 leucyl aminopeptidase family protein [Phycicoccus flavus]